MVVGRGAAFRIDEQLNLGMTIGCFGPGNPPSTAPGSHRGREQDHHAQLCGALQLGPASRAGHESWRSHCPWPAGIAHSGEN